MRLGWRRLGIGSNRASAARRGNWLSTPWLIEVLETRLAPASITWNGLGASGNWSTAANWVGGVVPGASDTAIFDGTSTKNCIVDVGFGGAISNLCVGNGFTGSITLNESLTVTGDLTVNGGTYNADGQTTTVDGLTTVGGGVYQASTATQTFSGGLTVSSGTFVGSSGAVAAASVTLSGGTLTAPSGTFTVSGNWNESGGTYQAGSGTVTFTAASGTQTLNSGGGSFYGVVHSGAGTLELVGNGLTVTNSFSNAVGTFALAGQNWTMTGAAFSNPGTVQLYGSEVITGLTQDTTEGTWDYIGNGAGPYTIDDFGATDYYNLTIAPGDGTDSFLLAAPLNLDGNLTVNGGTYNADGQTTTVDGLTTVGGGVYQASTATQIFSDGLTVSSGSFVGSSGAVAAASVTLSGGTLTAPSGTFTVSGNWNESGGTYQAGSGTVTFTAASGTQTLNSGGSSFYGVVHSGAGTLELAGNGLTVTNSFSNAAGTFALAGQNWTMAGAAFSNPGTVQLYGSEAITGLTQDTTEGTWDYVGNGAGPYTIDDFGATDYYNLTIAPGDGTDSFRLAAPLALAGNLTISGDTFSPGTNSVTFSGSGTETLNSGGNSFYSVIHSGPGTLKLGGNALTVTNSFNNAAGTFALAGQNWTMTGAAFSNPGTVKLYGSEVITGLTQDGSEGTWDYVGNGAGPYTINNFGAVNYYDLAIAPTDGTDIFLAANALSVAQNLTISSGTYNANGHTTTVGGLTTVSGGTYQASAAMQTLSGGLTVSGGSFTGSSGALATTNVAISAGTLTAPSGAFTVTGNWSKTGGTFTAGTNTVTFSGSGTQTLNSGGSSFYNLSESGTGNLQLTAPITVTGNLTVSSGTFTPGINSVTFNGSGAQTLNSGGSSFYTVIHSGAGTLKLVGNGLTVTNSFSNAAGTFALAGQNWTMTGATFSNPGTVQLYGSEVITGLTQDTTEGTWDYVGNGAGPYTIDDFGATDYYNLTIAPGDGTDSFRLAASLALAGNLTLSGDTFSPGTNSVTFSGSGTQTLNSGGDSFYSVIHSGAGTLKLAGNALTVTNSFSNAAGTFALAGQNWTMTGATFANAGTVQLYGSEVIAGLTQDGSEGTWDYVGNGAGPYTINSFGAANYYNLTIAPTDGTDVFRLAASLTVTHTLTISSGTLALAGQNWTMTGATFVNNGTVQLYGSETITGLTQYTTAGTWDYIGNGAGPYTIDNLGATGYYSLTIAPADGTDSFHLAAPLTLAGNLTISGGSFLPGTNSVTFNGSGTETLNSGGSSFYSVIHSGAGTLKLAGNALTVTNSFSNAAGTFALAGQNWTMTGATFANTGTVQLYGSEVITGLTQDGSEGTWDYVGNGAGPYTINSFGAANYYNLTIAPTDGTDVFRLAASLTVTHTLTISSGTLALAGQNWTMTGATFVNNGTVQLYGSETITGLTQYTAAGTWDYIGNGAGPYTIDDFGATDYCNLTIAPTDGTDSFLATNALSVVHNLTVGGGTYNADGQTTTVGGLTTVSGGIYQASTATQTFSGGLTLSGGSFAGSSGAVATTTVTLSAGTLTAPSGTFTVSGNWSKTGGTFTPGTGTVTFDSSGTQTLNSSGSSFYNLVESGTGTLQLSAALAVANSLTVSGGTLNASGQTTTVGGLTAVSGGVYEASTATQTLSGGLTLSGGSFTGSSGGIAAAGVTLSAGTLTAPSGAFTVSGNWSKTGGTFTPGTGTVTFDSSGTQTLNSGGNSFYNLVESGTGTLQLSAALAVSNNLNVSGGTLNTNGQTTTVSGLTTVSGGMYQASAATQTFSGGLTLSGGSFAGSSGAVAATTVTVSAGTLTAPSGTFTVSGNWSQTGGTFTPGINTVTFDGSGTQTLGSGGSSFYNVVEAGTGTLQLTAALAVANSLTVSGGTLNASGQTTTVGGLTAISGGMYQASTATQSLSGGLTVSGGSFTGSSGAVATANVTLSAGTLTAPSGTFTVSGDWDKTGGTFNPGSGTVTLTGTDQQILGTTTFYSLTKSPGTADTLYFDAAGTQTVNGTLTLQGTSGQLLSLQSTVPGEQWNIRVTSATVQQIQYVNVQDSNAGVPGTDTAIVPAQSLDSGDNTNWLFSLAVRVSLPASSTSVYGTPLTFTATASAAGTTPAGTIQFQIDGVNFGPLVALSDGTATSISIATLSAGSHTITADYYSGDTGRPTLAGTATQLVTPAPLTVSGFTVANKTYDASISATIASNGSLVGVIPGDAVSLDASAASARFDNANVGTTHIVSASGYTLSGAQAGNYTLTQPTASNVTISPMTLTITAAPNTKTYDTTTTASSVPTVSGLQGSDNVTGQAEAYSSSNAGTGKTLVVTAYMVNDGNGGHNYSVVTVTNTAGVINRAALTITATANTKTYDATTTASAVPTVIGLQGSDTVTGLSEAYSSANAGTGKTLIVTAYTVNDGNGGGNYTVTTVTNTTGVVNTATLTIAAVANTKTYDATTGAAATPTVTGLQGSDTVTGLVEAYTDANAGTNKMLTVTAYTVDDGNGGNNYTVSTVTITAGVINRAALTITATANTKTYDATVAAAATPTVSGLQGSDAVSGLTEAYANANAGSDKTLTVTAYTVSDGNGGNNYTVSTLANTSSAINKAELTITATANIKTYDATTAAAATPTVSGLQGSDSATGLVEAYNDANAGSGKTLTVTAYSVNDGNGGNNYAVVTVNDSVGVINPAALTITAITNTKAYDGTTTASATPTVSGLEGSDTVSGLVESYADPNPGTGKTLLVTAYTIDDGSGGNNYLVTTVVNNTGVIIALPNTTYVVSSGGDSGSGTLRQAILNADATSGASTIAFDLSTSDPGYSNSTGEWTITLASPLPALTASALIDATTQPGYDGTPLVELDGTDAGAGADGIDLASGSDGSTVAGLIIGGFSGNGISVSSSDNTIRADWIGVDGAGTVALANGCGVYVSGANNTIGGTAAGDGDVISGNISYGIEICDQGNTVEGNTIGLNPTGTASIGNGYGVYIASSGNTVGGTIAAAANVISGNSADGVYITGASSNGDAVLGNGIYDNGGLAINLADPQNPESGTAANTGEKTPDEPNLLMNYPVFTSDNLSGNTLTVAGYIGTAPGQTVFADSRIEVFVADTSSAGYGDGQTFLGYLTADADGNFSGTFTTGAVTAGTRITGTATDTDNDTSEFGPDMAVVQTVLTSTASTSTYGQSVAFTATVEAGSEFGTGTIAFEYGSTILGTASLSSGTAVYTTSSLNAGTYTPITALYSGSSACLADISNALSLTVAPRALTITAASNTKTYDATTAASAMPTVNGLVAGDSVTGLTEAYVDDNAGTNKTLVVTSFTVNDGNGGHNYVVTTVDNATGVIDRAALTISAATNTKSYDATTTAVATPTVSGLQGIDSVSGLAEAYTDASAGTGKTLTVTAYTVNDGNDGNNYAVTTVNNTTGVINRAPLTITAESNTKTYDATTAAAATPVVSGLQGNDTVTGLAEAYSSPNAGAGKILTVAAYTVNDGNGGNNYVVTLVNNTAGIISRAPLTIMAAANTKTYDATTTASATPVVTGLKGSDTVAGLTEAYTNANAGTGKTLVVTAYTIDDGNGGDNYSVTTEISTGGIINRAALIITAAPATKTYDATTTASAIPIVSGLQGSDTVTGLAEAYTNTNTGTGNTLIVTAYTVNDAYGGNNYVVSTANSTSGVINRATLTITVTGNAKTYDGTSSAAATPTVSGLQGSDSVSGLAEAYASVNSGNRKLLVVTAYTINDGNGGNNYTVTTVAANTGAIARAPLVVMPDDITTTYADGDSLNESVDFTALGLQNGETIGSVALTTHARLSSSGIVSVGTWTVTASAAAGGTFNAGNYTITYDTGTLTVFPKELNVLGVTALNKVYDGTNSAILDTAGSYLAGVVARDLVTLNSAAATGRFDNASIGDNKSVTISGFSIAGADSGDYTLIQPTTIADITSATPAPVTTISVSPPVPAPTDFDEIATAFLNTVQVTRPEPFEGTIPISPSPLSTSTAASPELPAVSFSINTPLSGHAQIVRLGSGGSSGIIWGQIVLENSADGTAHPTGLTLFLEMESDGSYVPVEQTRLDEAGRFSFDRLLPGTYRVRLETEGGKGPEAARVISLPAGGVISDLKITTPSPAKGAAPPTGDGSDDDFLEDETVTGFERSSLRDADCCFQRFAAEALEDTDPHCTAGTSLSVPYWLGHDCYYHRPLSGSDVTEAAILLAAYGKVAISQAVVVEKRRPASGIQPLSTKDSAGGPAGDAAGFA